MYQTYLIGLTPDRLVLNPTEGGKIVNSCLSIWLASIRSINWSIGFGRRLNIKLARDVLRLGFDSGLSIRGRFWARRAKALAALSRDLVNLRQPADKRRSSTPIGLVAGGNVGAVPYRPEVKRQQRPAPTFGTALCRPHLPWP